MTLLLHLSSCGRDSSLPSELSRIPEDLASTQLEIHGIYPDGWLGETVSCNLQQLGHSDFLSMRGTVPKIENGDFRTDLSLSIDGREMGHRSLGPGDFEMSVPVEKGEGKRRIVMIFSNSQILPGADGRLVGARLAFMGFGSGYSGVHDVVRGPGIELGSGWGPVETFRNETFRWIENNAQITVSPSRQHSVVLNLLVEPGPGVGEKGFVLKVLDSNGDLSAAQFVQGRVPVEFVLPSATVARTEFRLHVDNGGKRLSDDPRILNFRVFRVELK